MKTTNLDIRCMVADSGISYKQIAAKMGITHEYLSRVMGKPLTLTMRGRILAALDILKMVSQQSEGKKYVVSVGENGIIKTPF